MSAMTPSHEKIIPKASSGRMAVRMRAAPRSRSRSFRVSTCSSQRRLCWSRLHAPARYSGAGRVPNTCQDLRHSVVGRTSRCVVSPVNRICTKPSPYSPPIRCCCCSAFSSWVASSWLPPGSSLAAWQRPARPGRCRCLRLHCWSALARLASPGKPGQPGPALLPGGTEILCIVFSRTRCGQLMRASELPAVRAEGSTTAFSGLQHEPQAVASGARPTSRRLAQNAHVD